MTRSRPWRVLSAQRVGAPLAAVVVALAGCGGSDEPAPSPAGVPAPAAAMLRGLPQDGITLGDLTAPGTVGLFTAVPDLNAYLDRRVLPALVAQVVRPGRAKLQLRTVTSATSGSDDGATRAAAVVQAAGLEEKAWEVFFAFRAGYVGTVDEPGLTTALSSVGGGDAGGVLAATRDPRIAVALDRANRFAAAAGARSPALAVTSSAGVTTLVDLRDFPAVETVVERVQRALG